jgi:hypothetical protein
VIVDYVTVDTGIECGFGDDGKVFLSHPAPYFGRAYKTPSKPGCWDINRVEVVQRIDGAVVGEYIYNYSSIARTFHPFQLRGKWYALYSKHYTSTRIMSLPNCKDLGGEKPDGFGFCPTDYYVPVLGHPKLVDDVVKWDFFDRVHGFIAGCVWGDDSSWKIQYLDLSHADEGIIKREEKFGYIELPEELTLAKAVHVDCDEDGSIYGVKIDHGEDFPWEKVGK